MTKKRETDRWVPSGKRPCETCAGTGWVDDWGEEVGYIRITRSAIDALDTAVFNEIGDLLSERLELRTKSSSMDAGTRRAKMTEINRLTNKLLNVRKDIAMTREVRGWTE